MGCCGFVTRMQHIVLNILTLCGFAVLKTLISVRKEIRIHYIVLSRPSQKCEGLFVLKSDINVVFMGISLSNYADVVVIWVYEKYFL